MSEPAKAEAVVWVGNSVDKIDTSRVVEVLVADLVRWKKKFNFWHSDCVVRFKAAVNRTWSGEYWKFEF